MRIKLTLHGGLGNQLFQLNRAYEFFCQSPSASIYINTYYLERYTVPRQFDARSLSELVFSDRLVVESKPVIRWAKAINRLLATDQCFRIKNSVYIDSYCQGKVNYKESEFLKKVVIDVRANKHFRDDVSKFNLIHIRLTDFITTKSDIDQTKNWLTSLPLDTCYHVFSDDLELAQKLMSPELKQKACIIETDTFSAHDLLSSMASYKNIYHNGSTLAYWAQLVSISKQGTVANDMPA